MLYLDILILITIEKEIMKRYIITILMLLWSHTAIAGGSATIVNAGSDSGVFHQILTMIGDKLNNHKFIQANNPIIAETHFDKGNVLTMWSTEWPGDESLPSVTIDANTIVAVTAYETILCSRTFNSLSDMSGKTIKIATWGESPAVSKFIENLGKANNTTFEIVPYGGSGDTVRGYLGKDADTIFTTQSKQSNQPSPQVSWFCTKAGPTRRTGEWAQLKRCGPGPPTGTSKMALRRAAVSSCRKESLGVYRLRVRLRTPCTS